MSKIESVVFLSNYFTHHQEPFSSSMYEILGSGYTFIETSEFDKERRALGWGNEAKPYLFSYDAYKNDKERALRLINEADVVVIGSAPEELIKERKKQGKLIFRCSERPLKKGLEPLKLIPRIIKWKLRNPKNVYMLSASAYTAFDYNRLGIFKNKCYKWGYFTEIKEYDDIDSLISSKEKNSILWVARFLELKHPEAPVLLIKRLKEEGYSVELKMIGIGPELDKIKAMISEYKLENEIKLLGAMKPNEVREYMEKSEIFLFTSDKNEGWGAVLNESMNSACAVVSSHEIGATPFLVDNEKNGLIYRSGENDDLYKKVKLLLDNKELRYNCSKNAYLTMRDEWSPKNAAKKFIELANEIFGGSKNATPFENGVCSRALPIKEKDVAKQL